MEEWTSHEWKDGNEGENEVKEANNDEKEQDKGR